MTARPATRDAALFAIVARCRARAGLVLFVRSSAMACAVTLAVAAVTRVLWSGESDAAVWMASAVAIGVGCGVIVAVRRSPSRRQVAAHIDRHLRLEDTVVAALQMQDSSAPVGPLILRQALDRAGNVNAAAVFPMELRRPAVMLTAALLLVVATLPRRDGGPLARGGGRPVSAADAGGGDAAGAREAKPPAGNTKQPGTRNSAAGTRENAIRSAESRPSGTPDSQQPPTASQPGDSGRGGSARAADSPREAPALARASGGADARGGGGSAGSGVARGAGAGGVRGGTLIVSASGVPQATPNPQPSSRYQQAHRSAEAALTRGEIPPELRSYVREYFRAITR